MAKELPATHNNFLGCPWLNRLLETSAMLHILNMNPTLVNEFPESAIAEASSRLPARISSHVGWDAHLPPKWPQPHVQETTKQVPIILSLY